MVAPAVFAFGLVAFGFLGMGPVTIAVDSYGPVTDNAQSVYELSLIETIPGIKARDSRKVRLRRRFRAAKQISKRTTARATRSRRPPSRC
jgi:K(+)-stimulated pyrophosphate-energized sodium pump